MIRILLFHARGSSLECFCENYTGNEEMEAIVFCFKFKVKWQSLRYEIYTQTVVLGQMRRWKTITKYIFVKAKN